MRVRLRSTAKWLWVHLLWASGALALARRWARRRGVVVLTLHRVLPSGAMARTASQRGTVVSAATFEALLEHLERRCTTVDLARTARPRPSERPQVALTFDDGWEDNASVALPLLRRRRMPAAVFLCSERMDEERPFWPERVVDLVRRAERAPEGLAALARVLAGRGHGGWADALAAGEDGADRLIESLKGLPADARDRLVDALLAAAPETPGQDATPTPDRTMGWEQARAMQRAGVAVGSHTRTHALLTRVPTSCARREIAGSREDVERRLGSRCDLFSYPNGDWSPEVRALAAEAGYRLAFANAPGVWSPACDPLAVPRVNLCEGALVGPSGRFSPRFFDHAVFWRAFRSHVRASSRARRPVRAGAVHA